MKTFIQKLFFDKEFVEKLKQAKVHKGYLENLLLEGKITLKEYLRADYKPQP
ncbi:MAG: hypothetical protein JWQ40_887 [Segetibacter sp.]|nr:hypothetical protein [Segetibacter sp.]